MQKRFRRLKHFLFPHAGNKYKPGVFAMESVVAIVLVLCVFEGIFLLQAKIVLKQSGFLASVLPAALVELTNGDRVASGASALAPDALLSEAAQEKADDMAANGYFAHVSPAGKTPWYWLDKVGYQYSYAGENLAINFTDSQDVETAWMNSPEHHANIVKPEYTKIGIGIAQGVYQGQDTTFVVELFAAAPEVPAPVSSSPVRKPVAVAEKTPTVSKGSVLGAQTPTPASTATGFVATGASSPGHVMQLALLLFAVLVAALLGFAIFVKSAKRKRYLEEIGGGLALIGAAAVLVFFNAQSAPRVQVPSGNQAARVSLTL